MKSNVPVDTTMKIKDWPLAAIVNLAAHLEIGR